MQQTERCITLGTMNSCIIGIARDGGRIGPYIYVYGIYTVYIRYVYDTVRPDQRRIVTIYR
jgi:hypothetical protein